MTESERYTYADAYTELMGYVSEAVQDGKPFEAQTVYVYMRELRRKVHDSALAGLFPGKTFPDMSQWPRYVSDDE